MHNTINAEIKLSGSTGQRSKLFKFIIIILSCETLQILLCVLMFFGGGVALETLWREGGIICFQS